MQLNYETSYPALKLYINAQWLSRHECGDNSLTRPIVNPANMKTIGHVPMISHAQLDVAIQSAQRGFEVWRKTSAHQRCMILQKAASIMRQNAQKNAYILTMEQGKPLSESLREINLSADIIDFQAEEAKRIYGRTIPARTPGVLSQTVIRQPIGVVAALTPWNFPVNLPTRKLASALAAGCSVILKPDEQTPASAMLLVEALLEAGLPAETVQLVFGVPDEISKVLIAHPIVRKISFTGSVRVGKLLGEQCAVHGKRFTGELGGYASVIVAQDMGSDADVATVVKLCLAAKFRNAGQVCASPIRFLIHASIYEQWLHAFVAGATDIKLGAGDDTSTQMGPLTHAGRLVDMLALMVDAVEQGATVHCGGKRDPAYKEGLFFEASVLSGVPESARVAREEPFGPIALVEAFDDLDQAIKRANSLPYGLACYGFTRDLMTAHRLGEQLEAGMVGINHFGVSQPEAPFGGWKESGNGSEMGSEGVLPYTELKLISVASI